MKTSITILAFFIGSLLNNSFAQSYKLRIRVNLLPELASAFNGQEISVITIDSSASTRYMKVPSEIMIDSIRNDTLVIVLSSYWKFKSYKKEFMLMVENVLLSKDSTSFIQITFPQECAYNKHALDKKCPKCMRTDKVISILYGDRMPILDKDGNILDPDLKEYYSGDNSGANCSPTWYCKRDKLSF